MTGPEGEPGTEPPRRRRRHRRVTRPATGGHPEGAAGEQTSDDTDAGWGEDSSTGSADGGSERERWLHEQRPPHWD